MGTRAKYIITEGKTDKWLEVGDVIAERVLFKALADKCSMSQNIATTSTHYDGYVEMRVPMLKELVGRCGCDNTVGEWEKALFEIFDEDYEDGCDYVYIYNKSTEMFALLYMDFPMTSGGRMFTYNCVYSDKISKLFDDFDNGRLSDIIDTNKSKHSKMGDGCVYEYDKNNHTIHKIG